MSRAPIVIASTVAGLVLVLGYNPKSDAVAGASAAGSTMAVGTTTTAAASDGASTATDSTTTDSTEADATEATSSAASSSSGTQQVTGSVAEITERGRQYGQIQVKATVKGSTVIGVEITQLDLYDNRSQSIADYSVPQLEQQSIDAGSSQIDGVSGATYTSQAYATSLQSALDQLSA